MKRTGFDFSFWLVGFTRGGLCQGDFTVEAQLLFGAEFERHAAGSGDALEHGERVPGVFSILQPGDHGLRRADLPGQFGLGAARIRISRTNRARSICCSARANVFR
jgi:hypothetical protein